MNGITDALLTTNSLVGMEVSLRAGKQKTSDRWSSGSR